MKKLVIILVVISLFGAVSLTNISAIEQTIVTEEEVMPRALPDSYQTERVYFGGGKYSFTITLVTYHNSSKNT